MVLTKPIDYLDSFDREVANLFAGETMVRTEKPCTDRDFWHVLAVCKERLPAPELYKTKLFRKGRGIHTTHQGGASRLSAVLMYLLNEKVTDNHRPIRYNPEKKFVKQTWQKFSRAGFEGWEAEIIFGCLLFNYGANMLDQRRKESMTKHINKLVTNIFGVSDATENIIDTCLQYYEKAIETYPCSNQ